MARENLTEGSLFKGMVGLTTPMLIGAVLQNTQSLIDLFWVGRLGAEAIASVAISGTVLMVLFPLLMGLSTGTVAHVARAVGGGRDQDATHAAAQSLMIALVLGIVSGIVGELFSDHLLRLLGADEAVARSGGDYLRISLLGSFTVFVLFIANAALQGAGEAAITMKIMVLGNIINIVLDPLMIFGIWPFPAMGVRGAAIATVIAQAASAFVAVYVMLTGRSRLHVRLKQCGPDLPLAWRILRIGIPGSGQMLARSLMQVALMSLVTSSGTVAVAAYGIGGRLHMIILMPAFALGGAAATLVGQNLGAGKPDRARSAAWLATGVDVAFMAVGAALLMVFAPWCIRAFSEDPQHASAVVAVGAQYLRYVSPFYIFAALGIVLGRALNGAGDSVAPMIITIISLWGLQVPLAVFLSRRMEPPTLGIWWAINIAMTVNGLMILAWFELGRWKHMKI